METILLFLMLIGSPGPLDNQGGHIDPITGVYHLHAGTSFRTRYLDASGKIWEGQSPRPEEATLTKTQDVFWNSGVFLYLIAIGVASVVIYIRIENYISYKRYRHRRRKRRHH